MRKHLLIGMAIYKVDAKAQFRLFQKGGFSPINKVKLSAFLDGQQIFLQKRGLFAGIGIGGPFPMVLVGPKPGVLECRFISRPVLVPLDTAPTMVKMEM